MVAMLKKVINILDVILYKLTRMVNIPRAITFFNIVGSTPAFVMT